MSESEWVPYVIVYVPLRGKLPTRAKVLRALVKHNVSGIRVIDAPRDNVCIALCKRDVPVHRVRAHVRRVLSAEFHVETAVYAIPAEELKRVCELAEEYLRRLTTMR